MEQFADGVRPAAELSEKALGKNLSQMRRKAALVRWHGTPQTPEEKRAARNAAGRRWRANNREKARAATAVWQKAHRAEENARKNEKNWRWRWRRQVLDEDMRENGLTMVSEHELRFPLYVMERNGQRIKERFS